ncbi:flavin monoamine oxidase family protein [Longimicrobium sp.]|uniref:flavin monoamine oxidase family protein n=1 Tax=Longimicrobium sp. TaxID=2029185 RepID=UPI003B3B1FB2
MHDDDTGATGGGWTRRRFLEAMALTGGAAALYAGAEAKAAVPPLERAPHVGQGRTALVLGAGVGVMAAALHLLDMGFDVRVLEAQRRTGGRSLTLRNGDRVVEVRNGTREEQVFRMDPGLYFNAGPGRIPYHHTALIRWCRDLGVELEPYVMMTRANLYQTPQAFERRPMPNRRVANDTRGWIAELLAKAAGDPILAEDLRGVDPAGLQSLLAVFGDLNKQREYRGSTRSGYVIPPGVTTPGEHEPPLALAELVRSRFWEHKFYQPEEWDWQPTLFQPRGGMDRIERAMAARLGGRIQLGREVVRVETVEGTPSRVRVTHRNAATQGGQQVLTADVCISTIPLPILARTANNFSAGFRAAIAAVPFAPTCKVGWQSNGRFWEDDDQIYGGISYIDHPITQMWYPSSGFFERRGVLTGTYNYEKDAIDFGRMAPAQRLEKAAEGALRLHPQFDRHVPRDKGISIAWQNVPFQEGGWAEWTEEMIDPYSRLLLPEGNFWVAGDQVLYLPGWQEGAVLSARYVAQNLIRPTRLLGEPSAPRRAPNTARVVRGERPE